MAGRLKLPLVCLWGILWREALRFLQQRGRLAAALVRPLLWLMVFAVGFRSILGISIIPPYETYVTYETYIVPGLAAMVLLFNGMQSSLALVYDREVGSMRLLLTSPLPRWYLLFCKLLGGSLVSLLQAYVFLAIAEATLVDLPRLGFVAAAPVLLLASLMLGALGMLLSSAIRQLENFAGVMNFVIFPLFFLSSALYPLWRVEESSRFLATLCRLNPFTYAVEAIRHALYLRLEGEALMVLLAVTLLFFLLAVRGYDARSRTSRRRVAA